MKVFDPLRTKMVGRLKAGEPVWEDDEGKLFTIEGDCRKRLRAAWWPFWRPLSWGYRKSPPPHLNYHQVATASEKGATLLRAMKNGPLRLEKGFVKDRAGRVITTRSMSAVVMHWLEGCGVVFTRTPVGPPKKEAWLLDIDVDKTKANGVVGVERSR